MTTEELQLYYGDAVSSLMELRLWTALLIFIVLLFAFLFGLKFVVKKDAPQFAVSAFLGMGCLMLGSLFSFVIVWTQDSFATGYNTGVLGIFGGILFITASSRQSRALDGVNQKYSRKSTLIAALISIVFCLALLFFLDSDYTLAIFDLDNATPFVDKIVYSTELILLSFASFFNLRCFLEPAQGGSAKGIRPFNAAAFVYSATNSLRIILFYYALDFPSLNSPIIVSTVISCIALASMMPLLARGLR